VTGAFQYPWGVPPGPGVTAPDRDAPPPRVKPRGRRPVAATRMAAPARPTAPDWRYHRLTISGPAERVENFAAAALVGPILACPFDLHVLLPVPDEVLFLGPTHPTALSWLAAHCGITDRLREVVVRDKATTGRRLPQGHAIIGYGFFTDGETPQAAIDAIVPRWPVLRFRLVPRP
jgi:hypothetical protein